MRRIVLFSTITKSNRKTILEQIFPAEISNRVFAYMPANGVEGSQEYIEQWKTIADEYKAKFNLINNTTNDEKERRKILDSNTLVISGGNTFSLLHHLTESGLDIAIKEFAKKSEFVLAGFSAGALVLTPNIEICNLPGFDVNQVGLNSLDALSIVDFEVFPHYDELLHKKVLEHYRQDTSNQVQEITDEDYISIDL